MSLNSNDLLTTIKEATHTEFQGNRLATVTQFSSDNLYIQFYGDDEPSQKTYKRVSSYTPSVGDVVVVANINDSYVVMGKVV